MFSKKIFLITFSFFIGITLPLIVWAGSDFGLLSTSQASGLIKDVSIQTIIGNFIGAVLTLVGILFFALMIYSGIMWMIARGNQEDEKKALNTITGAIIGLIIIVLSYAITSFVFDSAIGGKTNTAPKVDECTQKGAGWSCKNIDDCGLTFSNGDTTPTVASKRLVCKNTSNKCELNKCTGGDEIVCCKSDTIGEDVDLVKNGDSCEKGGDCESGVCQASMNSTICMEANASFYMRCYTDETTICPSVTLEGSNCSSGFFTDGIESAPCTQLRGACSAKTESTTTASTYCNSLVVNTCTGICEYVDDAETCVYAGEAEAWCPSLLQNDCTAAPNSLICEWK